MVIFITQWDENKKYRNYFIIVGKRKNFCPIFFCDEVTVVVRAPGQTLKENTKNISSVISSQHMFGKNSEGN